MERSETTGIIEKVSSFVEDHKMIDKGDGIVIGLSGGADSVCLLFLLCRLREKYSLRLKAVHVNHGIREEAGDDAAYAEEISGKLGVDIETVCENVPEKAAEWGVSEEEAGRIVRYRAFERVAAQNGFNKIAVAHNRNDNAETVLFHMFRGSGLHGLTGIPETRKLGECRIIRPILCLERSEIEKVLLNEGIKWVTDRTNLEDEYSRNRIRHNILPEAEALAPGAVAHICESAESLAETEELLLSLEEDCIEKSVVKVSDAEYRIFVPKMIGFHRVIVKRSILTLLGNAAGGRKDIGSLQVRQVLELIENNGNRRIDLAKGLCAERSYDSIVIKNRNTWNLPGCGNTEACESALDDLRLEVTHISAEDLPGGLNSFLMKVRAQGKGSGDSGAGLFSESEEFAELNKYTKWLDYDKINGQPVLRTRQPGDYITVLGSDGGIIRKSLKDYMINCKIPVSMREKIPVVATGSHCIWLAGYRISEVCKLSENTAEVAELRLLGTKNNNCAKG